jgi:hypothetical protein
METLGGIATSLAAVLLFVGTFRDQVGISLFVAFEFALLFTIGAFGVPDRNAARQSRNPGPGGQRKRS